MSMCWIVLQLFRVICNLISVWSCDNMCCNVMWYDMAWYDMVWYDAIQYDVTWRESLRVLRCWHVLLQRCFAIFRCLICAMLSTAMLHVTRQAICMMMQMIQDCRWNDGAVMALLATTAHWVWFAFAHYFGVCFEIAVPAFAYVLDGSFGTWNDIFRDFRNHGCCFCNLSATSRVFVENL